MISLCFVSAVFLRAVSASVVGVSLVLTCIQTAVTLLMLGDISGDDGDDDDAIMGALMT